MMKNDLNKLFLSLSVSQRRKLYAKFQSESLKRGMTMFDDKGRVKPIRVAMRPWVVTKTQRQLLWRLGLNIKSAIEKLLTIYLKEPSARQIIPLSEQEEAWLFGALKGRVLRPVTIFDRLDCNVTFDDPNWEKSFCFLEPNAVGIGGVHYIPTSSGLIRDCVLPHLKFSLSENDDLRELLLSEILSHAKAIGRKRVNIALVEDQAGGAGTHEYEQLAAYFMKRGVKAYVADPRALHVKRNEIYLKDIPIDILYRDCELDELIEMEEEHGSALHALRLAFERNQVISSFAGEFDHKSAFEVFSDGRYARYFRAAEREAFKRYIPWTRLIWERHTIGLSGEKIDLASYICKNRERLVIKPNREYGGKDVVIGRHVSQSRWEKALDDALKHPSSAVAQKLAYIKEDVFPILKEDGSLLFERFYVVSGFAATKNGIAFLGRFSKEPIVNVSRKGGLIPVMLQK